MHPIFARPAKTQVRIDFKGIQGSNKMISARYKKLTGMHAGHSYSVVAPFSEVEIPLRWMLHGDANASDKQVVSEDELSNPKLWQPLS